MWQRNIICLKGVITMSDYSEAWEEIHKYEIKLQKTENEIKNRANLYRREMPNMLTTEDMIRTMFSNCINKMSDAKVVELGNKCFRK